MFKLIKYAIFLTIIYYALQYLNNLKVIPSLAFPEDFPKVFTKIATVPSVEISQKKQTIADLIEKIQKNELRDIQSIWRELGIKSELFKNSQPVLSESFIIDRTSKGDSVYVYKVTDNDSNDWQYLFFNIKNRSWNFYGHIDLPNQALSEPIARRVMIEDRNWLVITSKIESPTLSGMYQDQWYDLETSQVKEVLRYYVYQDQSGPNFIKRYSATVLETGMIAGSYFIDLDTQIAYLFNSQTEPETAFSISRKVRYLWDHTSQLFKNHNQQQDNLYNYGADQILIHNYLLIEELVLNGSPSQRNRIKGFLRLCKNSPEKKAILKIIF